MEAARWLHRQARLFGKGRLSEDREEMIRKILGAVLGASGRLMLDAIHSFRGSLLHGIRLGCWQLVGILSQGFNLTRHDDSILYLLREVQLLG